MNKKGIMNAILLKSFSVRAGTNFPLEIDKRSLSIKTDPTIDKTKNCISFTF